MQIILIMSALLISSQAVASETEFEAGKLLFQENCLMCHDAELDPPKAPPMLAVQKRYKKVAADRDDFINRVTAYATDPSEDKALMKMAVSHLGVMPNPGVEESVVRRIAAYIHDEQFAVPCHHMKAAMKMFKEQGDMPHYNKASQKYERMCAQ